LHVDRFSIGFGPKIISWKRNGVDYRISWIPLGGYVALPQLADMRQIEGETEAETKELPPISYSSKMIVSVMGAVFNLLFAFVLATILWQIKQPVSSDQTSTQIGYVLKTITLPDQTKVPGPAFAAGLQVGDRVLEIDGHTIKNWDDLRHTLVTGSGYDENGRRKSDLTIDRAGTIMEITVRPKLVGDEGRRHVGIAPAFESIIKDVVVDSPAATTGLQPKDQLLSVDGIAIAHPQLLFDHINENPSLPASLTVNRDGEETILKIPAREAEITSAAFGILVTTNVDMVKVSPFKQFEDHFKMTIMTLSSLLNPRSDIGLSKVSGPVGIINVFHQAAQADIRAVLWLTILVNINLAIFNLLPIPVLDGGHMMFATISKIRGRPLSQNFLMTTQSVFMAMLLTMVLYVSFFDVRRVIRQNFGSTDAEEAAAPNTKTPPEGDANDQE
jgi:regulator of sigma E protease